MGMDTNIKPPESLAVGSEYLFHSREWTALFCKTISSHVWLFVIVTWYFIIYLNVPNGNM